MADEQKHRLQPVRAAALRQRLQGRVGHPYITGQGLGADERQETTAEPGERASQEDREDGGDACA